MMKQTNSHGLTGMTVPLIGVLLICVLSLSFGASQPRSQHAVQRPNVQQGLVLQEFVHVQNNVELATLDEFLSPRSLPRQREQAAHSQLRLADAALQRTVAIARDGTVWFASLHNGNQQDGFIERVVRFGLGSTRPDELHMPVLKNDVTSLTVSGRGIWFAASAANLIGHVLPDGTVVEYPTKYAGALPDFPVLAHDGSLWFAETGVGKIARLDPSSGGIKEYPQEGSLGSLGPMAIDPSDNIWFLERNAAKIGRLSTESGLLTEFSVPAKPACATPCPLPADQLSSISLGPSNDVWFIDTTTNALGRLDIASQKVSEYLQASPIRRDCLTVSRLGIVWFCFDGALGRFDPGTQKTTLIQIPEKFAPTSIAAGSADGIWFTSGGGIGSTSGDGSVLHRLIPDYQGSNSYGDGTHTYLEDSSGDLSFTAIAQSPAGVVWALGGGALARFSPRDRVVSKFLQFGPESTAIAVAADHRGRIWLVEQNRLIRCDARGIVDRIIYPSALGVPNDIAVAQDDSLWLGLPGKIVNLQANGVEREYPIGEEGPFGIALDSADDVWFTARTTIGLLHVATGGIRKFAPPYSDASPSAIVALKNGFVWFTDAAGRIGRVSPSGGIDEFSVPTKNAIPFALSSAVNGKLWFTEFYSARLGSIDLAAHRFEEFPVGWSNSFPIGIVAGRDGSLWFSDTTGVYGRFEQSKATFRRSFIPTPIARGG